jgi:hypothetical protein
MPTTIDARFEKCTGTYNSSPIFDSSALNLGCSCRAASRNDPLIEYAGPARSATELRMVAVEYIIPYTFHPRSAAPPVLFDPPFQQVDAFQLWGLHAWVWENNPSGIFAPWNPRVGCANATATMSMSH